MIVYGTMQTSYPMRLVAAVTACGMVAACGGDRFYGYQYRLEQQFGTGDQPEPASREARQLLANAKTVAFFPPDICLNADTGERKSSQLRASCGVLLSTLERAAERAGYEVLSWQNLRGNKRPIDFAREASVDVLFEINEFDLGDLNDSAIERTLSFYEAKTSGTTQLQVSAPIAQQCRQYASTREAATTAALTGTIDIKTVSVSDGRSRWRYRKTLSQALGREYPRVTFRAGLKRNTGPMVLEVIGVILLSAGGALAYAEAVSKDDP